MSILRPVVLVTWPVAALLAASTAGARAASDEPPVPPSAEEHARAATAATPRALAPEGEPLLREVVRYQAPRGFYMPPASGIAATSQATFVAADGLRAFDRRTGELVSRTKPVRPPVQRDTYTVLLRSLTDDRGDLLAWMLEESSGPGRSHVVQLWDVADPATPVFLWQHVSRNLVLEPLPTGSTIVIGQLDGEVDFLDARTGRTMSRLRRLGVEAMAASTRTGSSTLAIITRNSGGPVLEVLDVADPSRPTLRGKTALDRSRGRLAVAPAGRIVVFAYGDGSLRSSVYRVYDAATGTEVSRLELPYPEGNYGALFLLAEGRRGTVLVAAVADRLELWDLAQPDRPRRIAELDIAPFHRWRDSGRPWAASPGAPVFYALEESGRELLVVDADSGDIIDRWQHPEHVLRHVHAVAGDGRDELTVTAMYVRSASSGDGAFHHLRIDPGTSIEELSAHDEPQPRSIRQVATVGGRYVVAYDDFLNLLLAVDGADGRRIGALHPGAPAETSEPSFDLPIQTRGNRVLIARAGSDLVDGESGSCLFVIEVDEQAVFERERRCFERQPFGTPRWVGFGPDDTLLAITPEGVVVLGPADERVLLPIDEPHPGGRRGFYEGDVSPDGRRLLLSPSYASAPYGEDRLRFGIVDLSDPLSPQVMAYSEGRLQSSARFVDGGRYVMVSEVPESGPVWASFVPRLYDGFTAQPVSAPAQPVWKWFYHGPGAEFGDGLFTFWHWSFIGWLTTVVDFHADPPRIVADAGYTSYPPHYLPRLGTADALMLQDIWFAKDDGRTNLWRITPDGSFVPHGHVDAQLFASLRFGFYGAAIQREDIVVTVQRDPEVNRPPVVDAGPDQRFECEAGGAEVRLDGSGSFDPDSTPGTDDDLATIRWTLDGGFVGDRLESEAFARVGRHDALLELEDRLEAAAQDGAVIRVEDTLPPEVDLSLRPDFDGSVLRADTYFIDADAADRCDGALAPETGLLVAPEALAAATVPMGGETLRIAVVERSDGALEVRLFGPQNVIGALWAAARAAGRLPVAPSEPLILRVAGIAPPVDGGELVAEYRFRAGFVRQALAIGPGADHRFEAVARDAAGNTGRAATSLRATIEALCSALPEGVACAQGRMR